MSAAVKSLTHFGIETEKNSVKGTLTKFTHALRLHMRVLNGMKKKPRYEKLQIESYTPIRHHAVESKNHSTAVKLASRGFRTRKKYIGVNNSFLPPLTSPNSPCSKKELTLTLPSGAILNASKIRTKL